jgi:hypothetical protein
VRLHNDNLPDWHVRERDICVRTMLTRNGVHYEWAERAAAVLLECDHAGGELDYGMAGWARDCGKVQYTCRRQFRPCYIQRVCG